MSLLNGLSIDVEDYFQVEAFSSVISPASWSNYPFRAEKNTRKILDILDQYGVKATFFCLGWVAKKAPSLIRDISYRGHEVASHGYMHRAIYKQSPKEFSDDVERSKKLLEDITGKRVLGYRAPTYSVTKKTLWALEILIDQGFLYDSSIFPVHHDLYGIVEAPRFPFWIDKEHIQKIKSGNWPIYFKDFKGYSRIANLFKQGKRGLIEFPITTFRYLNINIPIAGGGYFRLLPIKISTWALSKINKSENMPFLFYIHPWEFDPEQPRIKGCPFKSRFRHYLNLNKTQKRFKILLENFDFAPISKVLGLDDC